MSDLSQGVMDVINLKLGCRTISEESYEIINDLVIDYDKIKKENEELKEFIGNCYAQDYAGAPYTCIYCGNSEGKEHEKHCPIVRFKLNKEISE